MKQKIETPETKPKENPLLKLDPDEVESKLAEFQEALKNEKFKGIDIYKAIGLDKPVEANPDDEAKKAKIETLTRTYNESADALKELGVDLTPKPESKMSESEKIINERLEKQGQAKFAEQKSDLLKLDPDYPIEVIEKLDLPIEEKLVVMATQKEITQRNVDSIKKVKAELDVVVKERDEVKMGAPAEEKKDETGKDKVLKQAAKFGLEVEKPKDNPEDKK